MDVDALNKAFGHELRIARLAVDLTQEQLALTVDLDRTYISLLERGIRTPSLAVVFRLCQALKQQPEHFVAKVRQRMTEP